MALSLADLLEKAFPPENHLVGSGLLDYNSILIIGGPPKTYKSFLLNTIVLQLAAGLPLLGAAAFTVQRPCRVLLLEQEVGEMDLQERLRPTLQTLPEMEQTVAAANIFIHSCDHSMRLDSKDGVNNISKLIVETRPDVVCFDPLKEFHHAEENSAREMSQVFGAIDYLRERYRFASVITHHTLKPQKDGVKDGPDLLRGSGYIFGKGDSFIMLRSFGRRGGIAASVTLRRGRPIPGFQLRLNLKTLGMDFIKWTEEGAEIAIS